VAQHGFAGPESASAFYTGRGEPEIRGSNPRGPANYTVLILLALIGSNFSRDEPHTFRTARFISVYVCEYVGVFG